MLSSVIGDALRFSDGKYLQIPAGIDWRLNRKDASRPMEFYLVRDQRHGWSLSLGEPRCFVEAAFADLLGRR